MLLKNRNWPDAERVYEAILAQDPANKEAHERLVYSYSNSDDLPAYQAPQQQAPPPNQSTPPPQQQAPPAGPPAREATMKKSELQAELQGAVSIAVYTLQQFDLPILDSYSVAKLACQVMVSADRAGPRLAKGAEAPTQAPPQQQAPPPAQQQESAPPPNPSGLPTPYDAEDDDLPF